MLRTLPLFLVLAGHTLGAFAQKPTAWQVSRFRGTRFAYRLTGATRAQFEQAARRQAKLPVVPLAAADTLPRRPVWTWLDLGGGQRKRVKYYKLRLRLSSGKTRELSHKAAPDFEEEGEALHYMSKIPAIRKFMLLGNYWEWSAWLLVDYATGRVDTLRDEPLLSPGRRWLAAPFQGWPYEGAPNGVEIFSLAGPRLRQVGELSQTAWVPDALAWASDQELLLRVLPLAAAEKLESLPPATARRRRSAYYAYYRLTFRP